MRLVNLLKVGCKSSRVERNLPKGWRFCTELKDPKTSHIPLVILSEKATDDVFHDHPRCRLAQMLT